jgi:16S rRNA (cytidine1402-2'-O)-methyltransferase
MNLGRLYLIPAPLGEDAPVSLVPEATRSIASTLRSFVAEDQRSARRYLKLLDSKAPLHEIEINCLNEHTRPAELPFLLAPLLRGENVGLMTDAGCPAVADPGAELVRLAHEHGVTVVPLVGPSAILLALMASGMNGQRFAFQGYLPIEPGQRRAKILELEKASRIRNETEIFIETPYRTQQLLNSLLDACRADTRLCLAVDLTLTTESIRTQSISEWRAARPAIGKRPAVFLVYAG